MADLGSADNDAAQRAAFAERATQILAMRDLAAAFQEAGKLVDVQLEFRHEAAQVRAEVARRILDEDDLSIGQLAKRLGLSKGRTQRILDRAKDAESGGDV